MSVPDLPVRNELYRTDKVMRSVYSCDAGFYRLMPSAVIFPSDENTIAGILKWCRINHKYFTFRASGTSLSGQSVTDGILLDVRKHFSKFSITNDLTVVAQPGAIAGKINDRLAKFGKILGPDPASINACSIGGIVANNSSGMSSGILKNAFNTVKSLRIMLYDGFIIDTAMPDADLFFKKHEPEIYNGLLEIKAEIHSDEKLLNKIRSVYLLKNTIGYSLNAFTEFDSPVDILKGLMVGSEGTLGFISEITMQTFDILPEKNTRLLLFKDMVSACRAIQILKPLNPFALEIMDYDSLISVKNNPKVPVFLKSVPEGSAALLLELRANGHSVLKDIVSIANDTLSTLEGLLQSFEADSEKEYDAVWAVRKGLLASLGATKEPGKTFILEDICLNTDDFPEAIAELKKLLDDHNFGKVGIYGHGLDGNVHFMITESLDKSEGVKNLESFFEELSELVVTKYSGSLKAEHGTGRNMAPFVEKQWGSKAYEIMKRIKNLLDPDNIFNPGVIINSDPNIHLQNIKSYPEIDENIAKCIECGFCEPVCPSRDYTLSPRMRIILEREIKRRITDFSKSDFDDRLFKSVNTCAVDGMCSTVCPIGINTGDMVKNLRT